MQFPASEGSGTGAHADRQRRFDAEALPHIHDLFRTAMRVTGDRTRAEDAVQEAFLQGWKSFDRFEPGTNCKAWMFRILFHVIQHQRRRWFRFPVLKDTEEFLEANLTAPEPVTEELKDEEILASLDRLPADYRAVVLLVDVEEFPYREAAEILGIPIGTVMSRLSRGRRQLRDHLSDAAASFGIGNRGRKEAQKQ